MVVKVLRVGLLGAGIFATKAHAPALRRIIKRQQQQERKIENDDNDDDVDQEEDSNNNDEEDINDENNKSSSSPPPPSSSSTLKMKIHLVAIWSRHISSAKKLANTFSDSDDDDDDFGNIQAFDDIDLFLKEVDAVIMALPFTIQPSYIKLVLSNNKHLLSEKPIASNSDIGKELLDYYYTTAKSKSLVWSVAENYRYEPGIIAMADIVSNNNGQNNIIGYPHMISMIVNIPFDSNNPYLTQSTWRTKSESNWYGGLFVDAFVHGAAMLRIVLGSKYYYCGKNSTTTTSCSVSAITSSHADHIPSVDTMTAHVCWKQQQQHKSGSDDDDDDCMNDNNNTTTNIISGVLAVTFVCKKLRYELQVVGTKGTATLSRYSSSQQQQRHGWKIDLQTAEDSSTTTYYDFGGIDGEIIDWLNNIEKHHHQQQHQTTTSPSSKATTTATPSTSTNHHHHQQQQDVERDVVESLSYDSPREALEDLKFVEACLESGKKNGQVVFVTP